MLVRQMFRCQHAMQRFNIASETDLIWCILYMADWLLWVEINLLFTQSMQGRFSVQNHLF